MILLTLGYLEWVVCGGMLQSIWKKDLEPKAAYLMASCVMLTTVHPSLPL